MEFSQTHLIFNRTRLAQLHRMTRIMGMTLQTSTRLPQGMLVTHSFTCVQMAPKWKYLIFSRWQIKGTADSSATAMFVICFCSRPIMHRNNNNNKLCGRPPQYSTAPCKLISSHFDPESGVWVMCDVGNTVPILVFLGLSVLDLGPMYATDRRRRTSDARQTSNSIIA